MEYSREQKLQWRILKLKDELRDSMARMEMHRIHYHKSGSIQYEPPTFKMHHYENYHLYGKRVIEISELVESLQSKLKQWTNQQEN